MPNRARWLWPLLYGAVLLAILGYNAVAFERFQDPKLIVATTEMYRPIRLRPSLALAALASDAQPTNVWVRGGFGPFLLLREKIGGRELVAHAIEPLDLWLWKHVALARVRNSEHAEPLARAQAQTLRRLAVEGTKPMQVSMALDDPPIVFFLFSLEDVPDETLHLLQDKRGVQFLVPESLLPASQRG